ncbi:hypothetical protein GC163_00865 [bacterium]|nr:hypothetical protein [bacterium]
MFNRRKSLLPWSLGGLVLTWLCGLVPVTAAEVELPIPETEETWQVLYLAGQRVGYARIQMAPVEIDGQIQVRTAAETKITLKRFGQVLRMSTTLESRETLAGDLVQFSLAMTNPPASSSSTTGTIADGKLTLVKEVDGRKSTSSQAWQAGIKSPTYQDRLLRLKPMRPGDTATVETFFPEFNKPGTVSIEAGDFEEIALLNGQKERLQKFLVTNSLLPSAKTKSWVNAAGQTIKSATSMLGTEMVTYTVSKEEALKSLSVEELDLGIATLVKVTRIPNPYSTKQVVYQISIEDADPSKEIPTGDTQTLKKISNHVAQLTVTSIPLPATATLGDVDPAFLSSNDYLQINDEKVQQHANAAAGSLTNPAAIAKAMEAYVQKTLSKKNFSTALASAGEVARNLEGDCTEHAVLLAAMLRAKGIPSRVAVGLVYIDNPPAFGGHMWTEAHMNGTWIPLDGTLGRGGTGATHIKLGDASFDDKQGAPIAAFASLLTIIGQLQIEVVSVQ